jgi:ABC-type ATPase with predicted acetyltransferase domain
MHVYNHEPRQRNKGLKVNNSHTYKYANITAWHFFSAKYHVSTYTYLHDSLRTYTCLSRYIMYKSDTFEIMGWDGTEECCSQL